jgi:heme/copper-type cytochrome/quinol oxidase subunit 3
MKSASIPTHSNTPAISNGVFGMSLFVAVEILFFAGLLSAYVVTRQSITEWPPPDQPRLPIPVTLFNTLMLFVSGVFMYLANKNRQPADIASGKFTKLFGLSILFGSLFLCIQGWEWVQLIRHGLTLHSSIYGSTFYVIVGAHGVHVLGALLFMALILLGLLSRKKIAQDHFDAAQVFWYFVVGVWPIIFVLLYVL